ncbi:hypothetical protein V8J88_06360 [Massilia sp. W12]|uniref:hypothetical protein n=1 Tax=Massilia sp. W12 TaxID=3126507 RepID=UPI0030CD23A5
MSAPDQQTAPWRPLHIVAAGMCCAVGYRMASAVSALRANMDHFQFSEFYDQQGQALKLARLPFDDSWGTKRLATIAQLALQDCLQQAPDFSPPRTALMLMAAERGRPHTETERYTDIWHACVEHITAQGLMPFHETSMISPQGRAGIGPALLQAQALLAGQTVSRVLLLGVDSYLNNVSIGHYLDQERLLTSDNSDGFIPGEGAAALLLELAQPHSRGLLLTGAGVAREAATIGGDTPNRAMGLSQAMRQALAAANICPAQLDFRMNDLNGEQFFAKEAANACTRIMADESKLLPMLHLADCVGETGAAAAPLSLAYLSQIMAAPDGPGKAGLLHFGNDNGLRAACVVQYI